MVMARKKKEKEKDSIDQMLDTIGFRGLTQDEAAEQEGFNKAINRTDTSEGA
jgi:hypothetical protein